MNNKGFTLVELLAVLVILGILAAILLVNFTNIFSLAQDKVFTTYEQSMKDSTIEYMVDTGNLPTNGKPLCVRLNILTKADTVNKTPAYLDKFKNPNGSDNCNDSSFVFVEIDNSSNTNDGHTDNNQKYKYKVCLDCNNYQSEDCSKVTKKQKQDICGLK